MCYFRQTVIYFYYCNNRRLIRIAKKNYTPSYTALKLKITTVDSGAPRAREAREWAEPHSLVNLPIPESLVIT